MFSTSNHVHLTTHMGNMCSLTLVITGMVHPGMLMLARAEGIQLQLGELGRCRSHPPQVIGHKPALLPNSVAVFTGRWVQGRSSVSSTMPCKLYQSAFCLDRQVQPVLHCTAWSLTCIPVLGPAAKHRRTGRRPHGGAKASISDECHQCQKITGIKTIIPEDNGEREIKQIA